MITMKNNFLFFLFFISLLSCSSEKNREGFYIPDDISWAEQGWSEEERDYWHHLNAGQEFAPVSWVAA